VECITLEEAVQFGGCGTTGFFQTGDTQVAFTSELCTTTTSTTTTPKVESSESTSRSLNTVEIVGIVVGAVALVSLSIGIALLLGKQKTKGQYTAMQRDRF